jgi:hypothetical protein
MQLHRLCGVLRAGAALIALALLPVAPAARGQIVCEAEHDRVSNACPIGTPDEQGVTLQEALVRPDQVRSYKFRVLEPRAAHIYLGDLWYTMGVALWRDPPTPQEPGTLIGDWLFVAESRQYQQRVIQFVRPEIIVERLEPDSYTVFVHPAEEQRYDPNRPFTLRVALGPPVCGTARDSAERYQLGMSYEPEVPTAFSLLSFNAFLSPPYSDLYDFDWEVDGVSRPEAAGLTLQLPVPDLPAAAGGQHRARVTAHGVRQYPDPDPAFRQIPPTLAVECSFRVP